MQARNSERRNARVSHIEAHRAVDRSNAVYNVVNNKGSPQNSARSLASGAEADAMFAWFSDGDLRATKQWAYVCGMLDKLVLKMTASDEAFTHGPGGKTLGLRMPLLSDNKELIDWFANYDHAYDQKRIENHKTHDFWAYQAIVALRGDWTRLLSRCNSVMADPPGAAGERKYLIDHEFYHALAKGDVSRMEDTLRQIVLPKALASRSNDESGFTDDLISTPAFIYAKIAWRHGYEVVVDSPFVPSEWLPISPLDRYENHYAFLK
jgi:hypothetical protein